MKDVYIFENEPLDYLIKTGLHCVHKDYVDYLIEKENIKEIVTPKKLNYKIGIIIPNYNYEEWIDKCLTSIANQTYKNFEVIFCDDCSTDNSVNIAYKYVEKMNIKIVQLQQKRLNGGARNEAYLYLSDDVDYVYYIDSDDWLKDNKVLEKINNSLQGSPDVLFVGIGIDKNGIEYGEYIPRYTNRYEAIKGWSGSCGKVIRKELAMAQENLYHEGTLKEDRTHHYKICIHMKSFKNLSEIVYIWNRNNAKSVSTKRDTIEWQVSTYRNYADALELYGKEKGKDLHMDKILADRVANCKNELDTGGDGQQ